MQSDAKELSIAYARTSLRARRARFQSGQEIVIPTGRVRNYPGLASEAPPTLPFYVLAAEKIADGARVLDVGCGSGMGALALAYKAKSIAAVDSSTDAIAFARQLATHATFTCADACRDLPLGAFDAATCIDVLGHMAHPYDALVSVAERMRPGAKLFVAEMTAHPAQTLRAPARRAYGKRALESLLAAAGFEVKEWTSRGTFMSCVAERFEDVGLVALVRAARLDDKNATIVYEEAKKSANAFVRAEASLALAEIHVTHGNGDAACKELFELRETQPADPRAAVGLARIALLTGNANEAKSLATVATRLDPTEATAHAMLALAKEELRENAIASWRSAANLTPDSAAYVDKLVDASVAAGDTRLAVHAAEKLRSYDGAPQIATQIVIAKAMIADGRDNDAKYELELVGAEGEANWVSEIFAALKADSAR